MENYPSNNNNNHQQVLDPMPLKACLPSSDQSSSTSDVQENVESTYSSVTPLQNKCMYDPKMIRLTDVKRVARNRRKIYPKYGPYPCQWCPRVLRNSQSFAGHMRSHYRRIGIIARMAAKKAQQRLQRQRKERQQQQRLTQRHQQRQQQQLTPDQQLAKELAEAQTHAEAKLVKARAKAEKLAKYLANINAKIRARDPATAAPAAPEPAPAPAEAPAPVASGSGKQPLRMNDVHLRLYNSQFGQIITPGNKNNSVSTESASNATDSCIYTRRRSITSPNSSSADVLHYHHFLQVPPGVASMHKYKDVNKKPVVKQQAFPDHQDVKPPPGFHNQLLSSEDPHGRRFLNKEIIEIDDDDDDDEVVAYGSWDDLALRL